MKWRLTGRYLLSIVFVVILVIVFNILILLSFLIAKSVLSGPIANNQNSAESFTKSFQDEITLSNDHLNITKQGKQDLVKNKAWIQILDENGAEILSYRAPQQLKKKYTPLDIVQMYKYKEINGDTIVFLGGKTSNDKMYSYFIGFENRNIDRLVLSYDIREVLHMFKVGSIILIIIDGLIALMIGYIFSIRLTKPITVLIDRIKNLANKDYNINVEPGGIYKEVFYNVNHLSSQLKANERERKKLDQMKEEWIGNISHDIKTPLASIQGYAEMMKDKDYHFSLEEMREYAEIIERKSLYLKEVIEDLNLSTRLKSGELALTKQNTNLVPLLRNIVIDILNDAKYSNRNIEFQFNQEMIQMDIDKVLIRRAINNLIYNAIVHNDVHVHIVVSIEKNERTCIMIKDNGRGIKTEELDRIFDRYYRGTNTGESHKGSGLGMAIANDIIKAHNGEISIDSSVGQGTTVKILL